MKLSEFKFPNVSISDRAFPTFKAIPELLEEAKNRGFYNGSKKGNDLFSKMFFKGGNVTFKKDSSKLTEQEKEMFLYMKSFAGSFDPKHEEKEAICAMILEELVESID